MKCQHPFPVPNAIGNTNLWRFFMPCRRHSKLYENGWEIPCFFACGRRKRGRPYPFPHGGPGGNVIKIILRFSYLNDIARGSDRAGRDWMRERESYRELILENIEYDILIQFLFEKVKISRFKV